jgi:hypothetical protein
MPAPRERTRWILVGSVALTLTLYLIPYGHYVAYPLFLLSTYAHEMGHGITALLVGGTFEAFVMAPDGSGQAFLRIPDSRLARAATAAGGLVGPSLFAAAFFGLARRAKTAHTALFAVGVASVLALVLVVANVFGWLFVGTLGAVCTYLGVKSTARVAQVVLAFIAVQLSLSVFSRSDYLFVESAGTSLSDVAQIANALWLPYWVWGVVCGAISVLVLIFGIKAFLR